MLNKFLAFGFSCILTINSMFVVGSGVWDTLTNWGDTIARTYNNAVYNLLDHIAGDDTILSPSNNNILSPTANYYTSTSNTTNNTIVHDQQTYNNTINYVYGGDTNYTNYYLTSNQYDNRYYYTIDNSNNYYSTDTYYFYEDTNNYYTSYYEYTNYTIIEIPKSNPNVIMSYKIYYQTPSGQNSYNLTPNDVYGLYLNGDIYNYNSEVDGNIIGLWHLDGNKVNEVPNSDLELYYDGQTYVNAKFGSGLQLNGTTNMTILADQLPNVYSVRFWFYNALNNGNYTNGGLAPFAWTCCDYVYDNGEVTLWFNGIKGTRGTTTESRRWVNGVSQFGKPSATVSYTGPSSYSSTTFTNYASSYYTSYYLDQYLVQGQTTYTVPSGNSTSTYHRYPTFNSDSIIFNGTNNSSSGTNYKNITTYNTGVTSGTSNSYYYSNRQGNHTITQSDAVNADNVSWLIDVTASGSSWASERASDYNSAWLRSSIHYKKLSSSSYGSNYTGNYYDFTNCIIDDIAVYDGALWDTTINHIANIPTDPQEVGYIWTAPTGNFKKGDIAIKSSIEVTGYRIGGAQPTPPYTGLLYVNLDDNFYATDCKIYNGSTWIHIDFAVYNGTSWISGYNYDFLNGFAYPPTDTSGGGGTGGGDSPTVDYPSSAINAISTLGQILQWLGAFVLVFPLLPLSFRIFLGGILILLGTLITYKFVKK